MKRIHQNRWGNWNGYVGTRKVIEFGTRDDEAREWLALPPSGFEWTRVLEGPLTEREFWPMEDRGDIAFEKTPHVAWRIVVGGSGMTKAVVMVRARTARRADQWAMTYVRCRWLNRKGQPIGDRRRLWVASRQILREERP